MDGGEAVYFGERETGIWELPGLPSQFCCDLETALKHKVYWEICESFITQVFLGSSRCRNCQTEHTPSQQSTAQNTEGYLRALPHRPKGTFFFACYYNCWKKTFSTLEVQGRSKETAVGQLPEKPYKSMAASRLLVPRAAPASCGCQGSQMEDRPAVAGILASPHLVAHLPRTGPVLMCSCFSLYLSHFSRAFVTHNKKICCHLPFPSL